VIHTPMKNAGEILKEKRTRMGFSIDTVSKKLRIQPKYLEALEENSQDIFDSKAIARGFLQKYADFLGLDTPKVVAFWRRDFNVVVKSTPPSISISNKFVFTPQVFVLFFSILIVSLFIYLGFTQNSIYNSPPTLEIFSPSDGEILEQSQILLKGKASKNSEVWFNSRVLNVDSSGEFSENIYLHEGLNTILVKAVNPSNLSVTKSLTVESKKQNPENFGSGPNILIISLNSQESSVFLEVKDLSKTLFRGFLVGPLEQEFKGDQLKVYIDPLQDVKVKYNDQYVDLSKVSGDFYRDFKKQ